MTDAQVNMLATSSSLYNNRHKEIVELGEFSFWAIFSDIAVVGCEDGVQWGHVSGVMPME